MAITKEQTLGSVKSVGDYKNIEVQVFNIIKEDGVIISSVPHRHVLLPGGVDSDDNFVDTDISNEHADVQAVCNAVWTQEVKDAWKTKSIEERDG